MEAGTLVEWLVKPGDRVKRGDVVAVVETQKGAIEIEIFEDGVFERSLVEPGADGNMVAKAAELIKNAFSGRIITSADDPALLRLIGASQKL